MNFKKVRQQFLSFSRTHNTLPEGIAKSFRCATCHTTNIRDANLFDRRVVVNCCNKLLDSVVMPTSTFFSKTRLFKFSNTVETNFFVTDYVCWLLQSLVTS